MRSFALGNVNPRFAIPSFLILLVVSYTLLDTFLLETPTLPGLSTYIPDSFRPSAPSAHRYSALSNKTSEQRQNDHGLTTEQCLATYPRLYEEADRAASYYRKGITLEDVDEAEKVNAAARIVILDNQLYVRNFYGGINSRAQAAIAALYRTVISSPEPLPDVDIVLQVNDAGDGNLPVFALCRKKSQPGLWLMPDFGFYAWPEPMGSGAGSYAEIRRAALERELEIAGNSSVLLGSSRTEQASEQEDSRSETESDFFEEEVDQVETSRTRRMRSTALPPVEEHQGASSGAGSIPRTGKEAAKAMQEGHNEELQAEEEVDSVVIGEVEREQPQSWTGKISKLFWRGVPMVDIRQQLFRASENQEWSDVADVNWGKLDEGKYTSMADHCDYRYLGG